MLEIENDLSNQKYEYSKDPTSLTNFLKAILWISLGLIIISMLSDFMQINLLSGSFSQAEAESNDARQQIIVVLRLVAMAVAGFAFLKWVLLANFNCHGFGVPGMKFTPGWSIGWYFIPIANFWKPYQAMKEIWKVSTNPNDWQNEAGSPLLERWWASWLIFNILAQISYRASSRVDTISSLEAATTVSTVSGVVEISLYIAAIQLVSTIFTKQEYLVRSHCLPMRHT